MIIPALDDADPAGETSRAGVTVTIEQVGAGQTVRNVGAVGAGETRIYTLARRLDTQVRTMGATGCVHDRLGGPVTCAADHDETAVAEKGDRGARRMAWLASILFGILAVLGAVWLYRKTNPEPLTPDTAPRSVDIAQPGGAPSE